MTTPIATIIRTSSRARRLSLRVTPYPLQAELVIPYGYNRAKALAFMASKQSWIMERAGSFLPHVPLIPGTLIPVLGIETTILHTHSMRGISRWENSNLYISGLPEHCEERVERILKKILHSEVQRQVEYYARLLGCNYNKISLRQTSSRWGSCSSTGNLSFCWKLVFAPLPILHYVIAHEVAHLRELNHSPRFWQLVSTLCPDFAQQRVWLKENGLVLHRYGT